jgi:predicted short-subunit dehydrogenase-like oxidoreductase (DUF2520 family)
MNPRASGKGKMNRNREARQQVIALIGAGRVARGLGSRLREAGWEIDVVTARRIASARAATRAIRAGTPTAGLTRRVLAAGVILIAVPDDAVSGVATELARIGEEELRGKVVLHTSGALPSSVLAPLAEHGARTGVMHPMQTFGTRARPPLAGVLFGIEGHPSALRMIRRMVRSLGGETWRIDPARKALYHCAGTFAAAHLLASFEAGAQLLCATGMKRRAASRALLQLARQVLQNYELLGPLAAWTGPLSRGDLVTIALHRQALQGEPAETRRAYDAMTCLAARLLSRSPQSLLDRLDELFRASTDLEAMAKHRAASASRPDC